jgi:4-hydroxy-2-oxoheptanedioate aldolase
VLERNIKQRIEAGEVLIGGWAQTQSPELVEAMGYAEFDFVILDTEHTAHSYEGVIHQLRAAEVVGLHPIVRPPSQDPSLVSRALDLGAEGVFVPVIESSEQAGAAVKAAKYHPLGRRGICVAVKPGKYGAAFSPQYFDQQNDRTWLVAMVETWEGRDHMAEIVQVAGVDLIFVGPTDLSQSLGVPGEVDHPKVERAIEEIAAVAKAHGMPLGIHVYNVEDRKEMDRRIEQGFQLLTVMLDTALFFKACKQVREVADPRGARD